ncbi:MAG: LamG domain-containing protein [bacterium]|nr:LamG domain-containing protein [bacterium]
MSQKNKITRFTGLVDSPTEEGQPAAQWRVLENWRLQTGRLAPRPGMKRIAVADASLRAIDLNGSSQYVSVGTNTTTWTLPRRWTYRQIIEPDTVSGTQAVLGWNHADAPIKVEIVAGQVKATHIDTDSASVSITSSTTFTAVVLSILIQRLGLTLTMWVNGVLEATGTLADKVSIAPGGPLLMGADGASPANFFDGALEGPELIEVAGLPTTRGLIRYEDPVARQVRAWYNLDVDGNDIVKDYSRHRNHGRVIASATDVASLAHPFRPWHGLTGYEARGGSRRVFGVAGKKPYIVTEVG